MCDFPYYLNNNTCILYADNDINKYHNVQISFCFFTSLGILISFLFGYVTYRERDRLSSQQLMFLGLGTSFFFLLMQFIDPFGYGGWMPHLGDVLLANISTWISLSLIFAIFLILTKVFSNINYKSSRLMPYYMLLLVTLIITLLCSFFQVIYDRYIWRGIKLILFSIFISVISYKILNYLYILYNFFINNQENMIHLKNRIKRVSTVFIPIISTIIIIQLYLGIESLVNHTNINPDITWKQLILPIFHLIANYLGLFYFLGTNKHRKLYLKEFYKKYCKCFTKRSLDIKDGEIISVENENIEPIIV